MLNQDLHIAAETAMAEYERRAIEGGRRMRALETAIPRDIDGHAPRRLWRALFPPPLATRELYADIPFGSSQFPVPGSQGLPRGR
ncbi:MAG: hypothetical protein IT302_14300 [Dehalococcoidia bacterium]|nr:hypothetical protein [Dehalococcoidia bacterium]